jgi:serine/threonine-protein kinase
MGEVYRARDARLDRDVAVNMELVEGLTLADRIAQGALPLEESLPIARQIAEALEAAHEQGIVHRDLKPANVKVRADSTVKVLDFGLARPTDSVISRDSSLLPTLTSPAQMTGIGVVLGTAAYMSPEQAKGRPVDRRADIWAFGVVLTEMITGHVFPDGMRFVMLAQVQNDQPQATPAITVVQNWFAEFRDRHPARGPTPHRSRRCDGRATLTIARSERPELSLRWRRPP